MVQFRKHILMLLLMKLHLKPFLFFHLMKLHLMFQKLSVISFKKNSLRHIEHVQLFCLWLLKINNKHNSIRVQLNSHF